MTDSVPRFIVVDDEQVNNHICKRIITKHIPHADVSSYTDPEAALAFIQSTYSVLNSEKTILFLDINMPTMTGWKFVERFKSFGTPIKDQIQIYILSSSIDPSDKEKANSNPNIKDFLEKPLSTEVLQSLIARG